MRTRIRTWLGWDEAFTRTAGAVFVAAILARLAVFLWLFAHGGEQQFVFGDTTRYLTLADNVLSGVGFMYDGILETFRLPGYPAFFILLRLLHLPLWFGSLIQIVCGAGIAVWALWFAQVRLGLAERPAYIVGLIAALEPMQVYYSVILLPDTFYTVAFLIVFTLALRWMDSPSWRDTILIGVALGIGNYIRPVLIYFPWVIAAAFLGAALWKKRTSIGNAVLASALIGVISFVILSPWYVRNKIQFDHFALLSTKEYIVYVYGAAAVDAAYRGVPYETSKQELLAKARAEAPDTNVATFANGEYYKEKSKEIIFAHPGIFFRLYTLGLTSFWTSGNYQYMFKDLGLLAPPSQSISYTMLLGSQGPVAAAKVFLSKLTEPFIVVALFDRILWACVFALSLLGIYAARKQTVAWFTLLVYAYSCATILSTVIGVEARHRDSINPIIFAFAALGAIAAYKQISRTISRA